MLANVGQIRMAKVVNFFWPKSDLAKVGISLRVMTKGPAGDERDGLWRSGHGPSGQAKDERRKKAG